MKHYKNTNNESFAFDLDCFDEKGQATNEIVKKIIVEKGLIEITSEEAEEIRNYKSPKQIAEEERLEKLPSQDEILNDKITLKALELITELGLV